MNKVNRFRAAATALLLAFAVAAPIASAVRGGGFEMPEAHASLATLTPPKAETTEADAGPTYVLDEVVIRGGAKIAAPKPAKVPSCEPRAWTQELAQQGAPGARTVRVTTFCD